MEILLEKIELHIDDDDVLEMIPLNRTKKSVDASNFRQMKRLIIVNINHWIVV